MILHFHNYREKAVYGSRHSARLYLMHRNVRIMGAQGGTKYQGAHLIAEEAAVLRAFEDMVGEAIPHVSEIKWSTFGFTARDYHVTGIGMFSKGLPSLPDGLWDLERLERLWLTGNRLSPFPEDVRRLRSLRQLSLNMNGLTELPEGIWELDGMEYICFWRNQVAEISEDLGRLRNLEEFHPAANPITSLPRSITTLTKLRVLDLADTGITSLPKGFDRLQRLEVLNMRNTRLSSFPMEVCRLEKLIFLGIDERLANQIPEELREKKGLKIEIRTGSS